jgi:outer membrane protein TolC
MRNEIPWVACLALLAVGCVHYHPAPISPAGNAARLEGRTLEDPGLRRFVEANLHREVAPFPPETWDLSTLTLAAFYYSPELDVARARWSVAQAGVITAGGRPNPSLSLKPEYVTNTAEDSPWILGFSLDIPVETFGKRGYRVSQARSLSEASRLGIASVAWHVRSRVRSTLLDLWAARSRLVLAGSQVSRQDEVVHLVQRRLEVGEASSLELTREQVRLEGLQVAARDAERQAAEGVARLAGSIGIPAGALEGTEVSFDLFERDSLPHMPSAQELRREALLGRADIRRSLAEYSAVQFALQLEIARQYPDLHLGPGYTWEQGENHYLLGLSLILPILNRNRGPIAEAEARRTEAARRFNALQAGIIAELDSATVAYDAALRGVAAADSLLETHTRTRQQVEAAFRAGELDRLVLVGADLEVGSAELARFEAVARLQQALGALEDAVQRPLLDVSSTALGVPENDPRRAGGPFP